MTLKLLALAFQNGAKSQGVSGGRPPQQLFMEPPLPSQQSWEIAQQLQMGAFGPFGPGSVDASRWGGSRGPRPQARAFDVYQPQPQLSEAAQSELFRSLQMLQEVCLHLFVQTSVKEEQDAVSMPLSGWQIWLHLFLKCNIPKLICFQPILEQRIEQ